MIDLLNNHCYLVYTYRVILKSPLRIILSTFHNLPSCISFFICTWVAVYIALCMDIELWCSRRCIRFLNMAMKSDNVVVRTIINMVIEGFHSVMGRNLRLMQSKFKMDESNVLKILES